MSDEVLPGTKYDNGVSIARITEFRKTMAPGLQRDLLELKFLGDMPLFWYLNCYDISKSSSPSDDLKKEKELQNETQDLKYIQWILSKVEDDIKAEIATAVGRVTDEFLAEVEDINTRIDSEAERIDSETERIDSEADAIHIIHDELFNNTKLCTQLAEANENLQKDVARLREDYNNHDNSTMYILFGQIVVLIIYTFITVMNYTAAKDTDIVIFNREFL